jgi:hypothetical protein
VSCISAVGDEFKSIGGGTMKWLESWREERLRKKEEEEEAQDSLDFYEEITRRFYIEPGSK